MHRKLLKRTLVAGTATLLVVGGGTAYASLTPTAGPRQDGTAVTPVGFRVTPVGDQTTLGDLPLGSALSPDGRHLLVTNNGQGVQSLQLVDTDSGKVVQTLRYPSPESLYIGLAWSPDGRTAYASAAANHKVRVLHLDGDRLTEGDPIVLPTTGPDGGKVTLFPAGLAVTPDGSRLVVADQLGNAVTVADTRTGATHTAAAGARPVWVTLAEDGRTAFVSNQGGDTVDVVDVSGTTPKVTGHVDVGLHPNVSTLSPDGRTLYVANGDADTVSVVDVRREETTRTLRVTRDRKAPVGSNPTGLALDPSGRTLYVTNSGNNDVAVIDLRRGRVAGLIPTAWYPSSVTWHDGTLLVTNAKGLGAGPNDGPGHPDPERPGATAPDQYSGSMIEGTLSRFEAPDRGQLARWTHQVEENNRPARARHSVIPTHAGQRSPIKHVIYVVKENRTYDQVLGSIDRGNGDGDLTLFGDESAPNTRELARRFTTIDNFYADAEVSANGWNWVTQANSNPYAEQMWPANYSGRKAPYPSERAAPEDAAQQPKNAYIWQRLDKAGVSFDNYGFFVNLGATGSAHSNDPVLDAHTDHDYQGYNLACPDSANTFTPKGSCLGPRVEEWKKRFSGYERSGTMPTVQFVRFPSDHTSGTKPGWPTPKAYVADNDYALGQLVDTVSHSRFWKDTAILVTEDDAQNGPDHVDAHRTIALAISPYTQTGTVDSTFYSTASMVRTIGLIAGTGPLTQFDDYSTPMSASFTRHPNRRPYDAVRPRYDMSTVNGADAPMAETSTKQSLDTEDRIDEQSFNKAIWKSVKGADSTMPAPRHALLGGGTAGADGGRERND